VEWVADEELLARFLLAVGSRTWQHMASNRPMDEEAALLAVSDEIWRVLAKRLAEAFKIIRESSSHARRSFAGTVFGRASQDNSRRAATA